MEIYGTWEIRDSSPSGIQQTPPFVSGVLVVDPPVI